MRRARRHAAGGNSIAGDWIEEGDLVRFRYIAAMVAMLAPAVLPAGAQTEDHPYTTEAILAGARLYGQNCQFCHGSNGDGIGGVNLARQTFKRAVSDDDVRRTIHDGAMAGGMPAFPQITDDEQYALVAYIRSGFDKSGTPLRLGDRLRGKDVYQAQGCGNCHYPRGDGPFNAPSLISIGNQRIPANMKLVILDPAKSLFPINRQVKIVTRGGQTYTGRRLNEDSTSVQLIDQDHELVTIMKSNIKLFEKSSASAMPAYAGKIDDNGLADLLAYLVSLKGL
jgi:putative heme-binding domain-containing protein